MKYFLSVLITFLSLTITFCSIGQDNTIDSLENILKKEKDEGKQIDLLNQLFDAQYSSDYDKGLQYASLALKKSKLLPESEENKKKISQSLNSVGICYLLLAKYDLSLEHLLDGLEIAESQNDTSRISQTLNNIGVMYGYKGELDKAYEYFGKSAKLDESIGNLEGAAKSYSNLVAYYFSIPDYDKGKIYYDKSMAIFKELKLDEEIATLYAANAMVLRKMKYYKDALKYYNLSISINESMGDYNSLATAYINVSSLYLIVNKRQEAAKYGILALEMAQKLNSPDHIMRAYDGLSDIYEKSGNMGKALENYKLSIGWKDTIYNRESTQAIAEMTAKYNFEKREKENEILKQDAAINQLELDNRQQDLESSRIMMYSATGGGVLLLLLAFTLFNRNKIKQKANDELLTANNNLTEAKEIIEEKNKDITSSIEYAQYIQQAVLPKKEVIADSFADSFLILLPKDLVSGDFYWFQKYGNYSVLVMADCTGHGVPGGFMSMMGAEMLNQVLVDPEVVEAGVALNEIDKRIKNNLNQVGSVRQQNDGMDLALCIFNMEDNTLQFSGANRPLIRVRDGELTMIKPNKFGVGGSMDEKKVFKTEHLEIKKGDCYYMYSDGYPDQFGGPKNKKFMRKRLNELILEQSSISMDKQEVTFLEEFHNWKGNVEQIDDVCLVGVRV